MLLLPTIPLTPNSFINLLLLTMFQVKLTTPSDALRFLKAQVNHYSTILSSLILHNDHFNFAKNQYFTSNLVGFFFWLSAWIWVLEWQLCEVIMWSLFSLVFLLLSLFLLSIFSGFVWGLCDVFAFFNFILCLYLRFL